MRRQKFWAVAAAVTVWPVMAFAQQSVPASPQPFTATSSNNTPLVFGMSVEDASQALDRPLSYVNGSPGNEVFLAIRNAGGSGLIITCSALGLLYSVTRYNHAENEPVVEKADPWEPWEEMKVSTSALGASAIWTGLQASSPIKA